MPKIDRCIVRNEAYQKKSISIRERHNERKNQEYSNRALSEQLVFENTNPAFSPAWSIAPIAGISCISTHGPLKTNGERAMRVLTVVPSTARTYSICRAGNAPAISSGKASWNSLFWKNCDNCFDISPSMKDSFPGL